ncbi:MAG: ankyrin repeat domain-containing protein [Pseudomonadota bacterium]
MRKYVLFVALLLIPTALYGASFDCAKASTTIEKLICQDPTLSDLDSKMSEAYEQVLKNKNDAFQQKELQRGWLSDIRNRCTDLSCLKLAYTKRIEQLAIKSAWMTNEKEQAICKAVVDAVNDGSIAKRIIPFEQASQEDKLAWKDNSPSSMLYLYQTLKINAHGKPITLGLIQGGGTCGNCDIEDIKAPVNAVYPPYDSEERFRWGGWGECDHFLFIEGEPIIVTGNFKWGLSNASFVSWLAPDGAKRALCAFDIDPAKKPTRNLMTNNNPKLCDAVSNNRFDEIPWTTSLTIPKERSDNYAARWDSSNNHFDEIPWTTLLIIPKESSDNNATRWDSSNNATLDINLDGKDETIVLFDYSSGAGCGSYRQWLREFTPYQGTALPEGSQTPLNQIFAGNGNGPIKNAMKGDDWYTIKLFRYAGKPYILAQGTECSAQVISVWENQISTWCEYQVLPQYKVGIYYPVETWPELKISTFKKTKGAQALHNAAYSNNMEKVITLIRSGTPVDVADESGLTPLGMALLKDNIDMIKLLLDNGASVDGVRGWRMSPLMSATNRNNFELVKYLLERKADPNLRSEPHPLIYNEKGWTALGLARKTEEHFSRNPKSEDAKKNKRIIELLLKAGATQ